MTNSEDLSSLFHRMATVARAIKVSPNCIVDLSPAKAHCIYHRSTVWV